MSVEDRKRVRTVLVCWAVVAVMVGVASFGGSLALALIPAVAAAGVALAAAWGLRSSRTRPERTP